MRHSAPALLGATLLAAAAALGGAARASEPASSGLTVPRSGSVTATWSGSVSPGVDTGGCTTSVEATSDHHGLSFTVPAGLYTSVQTKVTVTIDALADSDLDLLITDPAGTVVADVASGGGDETAVFADPAPGTYAVTVCAGTVLPDDYAAKAVVVSSPRPKAGTATGPANVKPDQLLSFTPATVVDPVLFGGEPGINADPSDPQRYFVDWPIGANQTGVLYRSTDGGVSFQKRYADALDLATAGPACQGRQVPICPAGGGGDTDVHLNPTTGSTYFSSQVSLANEAIGTSDDHGTTFPAAKVDTAIAKTHTGVDRQWISSFTGTSDVYLSYHVPLVGQYVHHSAQDGALGSWDEPGVPQIIGVTQSGSQVADNGPGLHGDQAEKAGGGMRRALYIGYLGTTLVPGGVAGFNVGVSTDGAKTFTSHQVPDSENARNFTVLTVDRQGNLYATWTDSTDQITYLSTSKADAGTNRTAPGSQWSKRVPVSGGALTVTIFPNAAAGDPGRAAIGFYGTSADAATPDDVKPGQGGWYPYVSTTTNGLCQWDAKPCASPTFHQSRIAERPNQDDNICTSGTTCLVTGGNRNLADYFDITVDDKGYLGFVWSDGNNATKQPYVKVARQTSGPSLLASAPAASRPVRANGVADPAGDAIYPFAGKLVETSPNAAGLDLRGTTVRLKDASTFEVRMRLADTGALADVPAPSTQADGTTLIDQARYVTRWETGGNAYYVEATVPRGGEPEFGAGVVDDDQIISNPGATRNGYANSYVPQSPATGSVQGGELVVDVPAADVGGLKAGSRLVSVGSYAILTSALADATKQLLQLPLVVDSSPTFTTTLTAARATGPTAVPPPAAGPGSGPSTGPLAATGLPAGMAAMGLLLLGGAALVQRRTA